MIVLDTHIWFWWINQDRNSLGANRCELIADTTLIAVSAISCFEIAWLQHHQRISLPCSPKDWFDKALDQSGILLLPITPDIAARAVQLHEHHSDPIKTG